MEIISKLREGPTTIDAERRLKDHPYLKAAENGTLNLSQRRAFAQEQYAIQLSDAISFASLAGHINFIPSSLTGLSVPSPPLSVSSGLDEATESSVDLFQFLLGGEIFAAPLLLSYAKSVGLDDEASLANSHYSTSAKGQAYPSYWARLALSKQRAAGAAACAVNFPAWGKMCQRLLNALGDTKNGYGYQGIHDDGLKFVKFFATPIDNLDVMAAAIIEREGVTYEEMVEPVRLLQEYEIMFWDAVFDQK